MKTYKKITLLALLSLMFLNMNAQREILSEDVDNYTVFQKQKFGPNSSRFTYNYLRLAFFTPEIYDAQLPIKYGTSFEFSYGIKQKFKLTSWLATGMDLNWSVLNYNLQDTFLYSIENKQKEKLTLGVVGAELFFRINFGKTGNTLGKYVDLGGFGYANISNRYTIFTKNNNPSVYQASSEKFIYRGMDLYNTFNYGALVRFGVNKFAVVVKYRYSDLFNDNGLQISSNLDLPKFTIGMEFGVF